MLKQEMFLILPAFYFATALVLLTPAGKACAYRLPDTGETACYMGVDPFDEKSCTNTGQDGEYNINPMSFTDNGNGTVTDNNTGLMWMKGEEAKTYNWYKATGTYHKDNNPSSENVCGNHGAGWRLPSIRELMSIVDYSIPYSGPTIQKTYFPEATYNDYWSSTACAYTPDYGWATKFITGGLSRVYMNDEWSVRCVRGTENNPAPRFVANGDGTVTDNKTGLMWQKCTHGQVPGPTCSGTASTYTWSQALSYCNGLQLPSTNLVKDWRLPNLRELESLTDYTSDSPTIDSTFFPNTVLADYWSSTTVAGYPNQAWTLDFYIGISEVYSKPSGYYARCVRTGPLGPLDNLVRLMRGENLVANYPTIKEAYAAAMDGDVIKAHALDSAEILALSSDISVEIKGGYDSSFAANPDATTIFSLTITSGAVTVENMILK
jgi:hypothetical protein